MEKVSLWQLASDPIRHKIGSLSPWSCIFYFHGQSPAIDPFEVPAFSWTRNFLFSSFFPQVVLIALFRVRSSWMLVALLYTNWFKYVHSLAPETSLRWSFVIIIIIILVKSSTSGLEDLINFHTDTFVKIPESYFEMVYNSFVIFKQVILWCIVSCTNLFVAYFN